MGVTCFDVARPVDASVQVCTGVMQLTLGARCCNFCVAQERPNAAVDLSTRLLQTRDTRHQQEIISPNMSYACLHTHRRRLALSSTRTPYGCHRSSSTTVVLAAAGRRGAGVMTTPATSASKGLGFWKPGPTCGGRQVTVSVWRSTSTSTAAGGAQAAVRATLTRGGEF